MEVPNTILIENDQLEQFSTIVLSIESDYRPQDLQNQDYKLYNRFVTQLCKIAEFSEAIYAAWFQKIICFLLELYSNQSLEAVAARLSLPFLDALSKIRLKLMNEVHLNIGEGELNANVQNKKEHIKWLDEYCDTLYKVAIVGLRYKTIAKIIVNNLCLLNEISSTFYEKNPDSLVFYVECLIVQNFEITSRALTSIKIILSNEDMNKEQKMIVVNYFVQDEPSTILYNLLSEKSPNLVVAAFEVINLIHEFVERIASWKDAHYCCAYLNMFNKNLTVRTLAGQLFLKGCISDSKHDGDVLIDILEFYFKYQKTKDNLVTYIDILWDFEYMKNFDNLLVLFESTPDTDCTVIVSNFIVALVKRMLQEYEQYQENILNLLKKLPLLLENLENDITAYNHLLEVFLIVDLKLYDPLHSGHLRYRERLIKCLSKTFKENDNNYMLLKYIFYILNKFCGFELIEVKEKVNDIVEGTYNNFMDFFSSWVPAEGTYNKSDLSGNVYKMASVVSHAQYLENSKEDQLLAIVKKNLTIEKNFSEVSEDIEDADEIEAVAIKLMSDLLKRKILKIIKQEEELFPEIELIRNITEEFLDFIKVVIIRKKKSLFFLKLVFEALIFTLLATQRKLSYSPYNEIKNLMIPVATEDYLMITDLVSRLVYEDYEGCERYVTEGKKDILKNFVMLHQKHIGLPFSARAWKVVIYYGFAREFQDELLSLIKSLLFYETPTEEKYSRFCNIFSIVVFNLAEQQQQKISPRTIENTIKKYADIFCCELRSHEKQIVISSSILSLLERLDKKISLIEKAADSGNRLIILKQLRPLLELLNTEEHIEVIRTELKKLSEVVQSEELDTLKEFEAML